MTKEQALRVLIDASKVLTFGLPVDGPALRDDMNAALAVVDGDFSTVMRAAMEAADREGKPVWGGAGSFDDDDERGATESTLFLLKDLLDNPALLEPPVAIVPRFAYEGRLTLFAAPRKRGKSTFAGAAAATASTGELLLGQPCQEVPVLIGCFDEPIGDAVRRLHVMGANPLNVFLSTHASVADLIETAERMEIRLVIVDTLGDLLAREVENENDAPQVRRALGPLRAFARRTGAAVVLLHHTTKATGKSRGSGAFEEIVDLVLTLGDDEENPIARKVSVEGRVGVDDFRFQLTPEGPELVKAESTITDLVRAAIWAQPGCTQRSIRERVPRNVEEVRSAIARLGMLGEIENRGSRSSQSWYVVEARNHSGTTHSNPSGTALEPLRNHLEPPSEPLSGSSPVGGTTQTEPLSQLSRTAFGDAA